MMITREFNGVRLEIKLTPGEMDEAYEKVRIGKWETCIRRQIELNAENLRFTEDFDEDDFVNDCLLEVEEEYYEDDYDAQAEVIVFSQAELNDIWTEEGDDGDAE